MRVGIIDIIALFALVGVSLATLFFGFGSPPYYIAALFAFLGGIAVLFRVSWNFASHTIFLSVGVFSIGLLHVLFSLDTGQISIVSLFRGTVIAGTLLVAFSIALLDERRFQRIMLIVALCHLAYFVPRLGAISQSLRDLTRFGFENASVAATSEIALGLAWAGILARHRLVMVVSVAVGFQIILATQMRTSGVALVVSLFLGALLIVNKSWSRKSVVALILLSVLSTIAVFAVEFDQIVSSFRRVMMLDDEHRGISTGLSGRTENISAALGVLGESLIFGGGFDNPLVNSAHNGYVLTIAQMGIILGGAIVFLFLRGIRIAFRTGDIPLITVVVGFALFLMGQPRNINLQLCVLIGVTCVIRGYYLNWKSAAARRTTDSIFVTRTAF